MSQRLMGMETEYAITGLRPSGAGVDRRELLDRLLRCAEREMASLPDFHSGLFLQNGARFYVDFGLHPEMSTPECSTPWEVVRYILAGERILTRLACKLEAERPDIAQLMLFKSNVDYGGTHATWGCHESYMHRANPATLSRQIIPHLVSRVIYTGAGGFNSTSPGLQFMVSPRAAHIMKDVSDNSTSDRGIFHTKDESLAREGYHRLHVICGESLCSETAMWLKVATTALVVAMIEAGACDARPVELAAPVEALRAFAFDPDCKALAVMSNRARLTALEIQHHYLTQAEKRVGEPFMPTWAEAVCVHWHAMLNRLLDAPDSVTTRLDWAIKLALYRNRAERRGIQWSSLPHWTHVLTRLRYALEATEHRNRAMTTELILSSQSPVRDEVNNLATFMCEKGLSWHHLDAVIELRQELFEIDTRFMELGERGIFAALDASGALAHRFTGVERIEEAIENPSSVSRAQLRGNFIRRMPKIGDANYRCDWQGIWDEANSRMMDLTDPFETQERWRGFSDSEEDFFELPEMLRVLGSGLRR